VYLTEAYKLGAICHEIETVHATGQPILVGTVSIEKSEVLSAMLRKRGIKHEILNAKNHAREALIIEDAGAKGAVTIATNMAGRGTDIKLGGSLDARIRAICGSEASPAEIASAKQQAYPKWKDDYEEVKRLGGLYILGTERHESRRIDNQLRGRSGRQGDPGVSRFFLSLDDTLMRLFAKDSIRSMLGKIGMGAEPIEHSLVSRAIEKAQTRVEEQNFEIRKHLLEYDDVLNEQRNYLYRQRDDILMAEDLMVRGLGAVKDIVDQIVSNLEMNDKADQILANLKDGLDTRFHFVPELQIEQGEDRDVLKEKVFGALEQHIKEKIAITGEKPFNDFLRFQYLRQIDMRWQDHLDQLEALREAVYLRAYAQKNPLLEYKLEGFDIFDKMIEDIRSYIAVLMVRVRIQQEPDGQRQASRRAQPQRVVESHGALTQFGAPPAGRSQGAQQGQAPVQIRRTTPKVGRNDPCPCGSGKKYKHCHGRNV
jgi:preprotein translocase subunit SecA